MEKKNNYRIGCQQFVAQTNGQRTLGNNNRIPIKRSSDSSASSSSSCAQLLLDLEAGNKCGKCQNHEIEVSKKGHARDCPFKRCECLKCRLLDARSDILQVISGKETKLKGTKKDPNCGFCQNHGVKILRKGHVRSCGFGQERHFKLENCFDCEVHYIRNEVNRLQIKMRRAMKEDRTLSEEQRKTAREAITRDEVEKVCDMARSARKKRETILSAQQVGESSAHLQPTNQQAQQQLPVRHSAGACSVSGQQQQQQQQQRRNNSQLKVGAAAAAAASGSPAEMAAVARAIAQHHQNHLQHSNHQLAAAAAVAAAANSQANVWRPWSQHQQQLYLSSQQQQQPLMPLTLTQAQQQQQVAQSQQQQQTSLGQNNADQMSRVCSPMPIQMQLQQQQQQQNLMVNHSNNSNQALEQLAEQANDIQVQQRQQLFNTIFGLFFAQIAQQNAPAANNGH